MNQPASRSAPSAPKPSRRVLTVLVLATLLAPLLAYICVTAMGVLAAAPLPYWAKASRTGMARYDLLLNLLSCAMPSVLLGWALGCSLRRDARWCAALLGVLALVVRHQLQRGLRLFAATRDELQRDQERLRTP